ncbi:hypothetical protein HOH67_00105 [Candidatus Peregrinibacteria bacterium]|nr:hypothetical protein [Candidatus Peregrinibacteria bacterium]MBT5516363.1 hypothetical protein [Candidatus Peregrinibacteria bacterium]MBT5823518.1 hypothetical protein [Candidatus Peregrinibacteria bacterium]
MDKKEILQHLAAFWPQFGLHKIKCMKTGKDIISVFGEDCSYPVWHREEWLKHADPPFTEFDSGRPFFDQLWELFQKCPIPHNVGVGNENCEYTDDWWYSKNCFLSHSGMNCEDVSYVYRSLGMKDCQFCVFCFDSELCTDLINCRNCYSTVYALNSRQCRDSAFIFDCRNCSDCLFSWNLRNKQYCIFNQQYSKEEYERERAKYDFYLREHYEKGKEIFADILRSKAWWPCLQQVQCENVDGDFLDKCKNCSNTFFVQESEDCKNVLRAFKAKNCVNSVSTMDSELVEMSCMAQDKSYDIKYSNNVVQSSFLEYCNHCYDCEHCFGCCGLVGKKYHIFNQEYTPEEYEIKVLEIKTKLREEKVYGQFYPLYFAANLYEESLAGVHWPQGENSFKDKPFHITERDKQFCEKNRVPLPNTFYVNRLMDNLRWMFFTGELRETTCAETGDRILTGIPKEFDGRILSEQAYLDKIA